MFDWLKSPARQLLDKFAELQRGDIFTVPDEQRQVVYIVMRGDDYREAEALVRRCMAEEKAKEKRSD